MTEARPAHRWLSLHTSASSSASKAALRPCLKEARLRLVSRTSRRAPVVQPHPPRRTHAATKAIRARPPLNQMPGCYLLATVVPPPQASQWSVGGRPRFAAWALVLADSCMYEHALLHSGHASAGPMHRKPASGRHTLAFVAGCELLVLLVLLRASSGSNPPPANGVTGSPSAGGLSRCCRWSSDGLLWGQNSMSLEGSWASRGGLSDVESKKQVVHDFMPDTLAGVHSACGACLSTQCCWCCD